MQFVLQYSEDDTNNLWSNFLENKFNFVQKSKLLSCNNVENIGEFSQDFVENASHRKSPKRHTYLVPVLSDSVLWVC
jgi:hypothetical protein